MYKHNNGFTLVELLVVVVVLSILSVIGYLSLLGYGSVSRDTTRVTNLQNINKVIELYKLDAGAYPEVTDPIEVSYSGTVIWEQGSFGDLTRSLASRISEVPTDPLTFSEFAYSKTIKTGEFQVGTIVERDISLSNLNKLSKQTHASNAGEAITSFATTVMKGNYNGKFITHKEVVNDDLTNIYLLGVPSILVNEIEDVDLQTIFSRESFVYPGGPQAPSTFSGSVEDKGNWNFNPNNTSPEDYIIYEGTENDIGSGTGKLELIQRLKDYYISTDIENSTDYDELREININEDPNEALILANAYINNGLLSGNVTDTTLATCNLPWGGSIIDSDSVTAYLASNVPYGTSCMSEVRECTNGSLSGTYGFQSCSVDAEDTTPDPFSFNDQNNQGISPTVGAGIQVTSNSIIISGINNTTPVSISGQGNPEFSIDGGPWVTSGTITDGQSIEIRLTTADTGLTAHTATIDIGGVTNTWTVTTAAEDCSLPWGGTLTHSNDITAYQASSVPYGNSCISETRTCNNGTLSGTYTNQTCNVQAAANCSLAGVTVNHGANRAFYSSSSVPYGSSCSSYAQTRTCNNGSLSGSSSYNRASCSTQSPSNCSLGGVSVNHGSSRTFYSSSSVPHGSSCSSYAQTRTCSNGSLSGNSSYNNSSCSVQAPSHCTLGGVTISNGSSRTFYNRSVAPYGSSCSSYAQTRTCSNGSLSGSSSYSNSSCSVSPTVCPSGQSCYRGDHWSQHGCTGFVNYTGYVCRSVNPATYGCAGSGNYTNWSLVSDSSCAITSEQHCRRDGVTVRHGTSRTFYTRRSIPGNESCSSYAQSRTCNNGTLSGNSSYDKSSCAPAYTYSWYSGGWGGCSRACGGGTQSRSVYCRRSDGASVSDSYCGGGKPSSSQSCNTQSCTWTYLSDTCVSGSYANQGNIAGSSCGSPGSTTSRWRWKCNATQTARVTYRCQ